MGENKKKKGKTGGQEILVNDNIQEHQKFTGLQSSTLQSLIGEKKYIPVIQAYIYKCFPAM